MSRPTFSRRPATTAAPCAVTLSPTGLTGAVPSPAPSPAADSPYRDPELVRRIGRAVAEEAAGTGIDRSFAPCLCAIHLPPGA